MDLSRLSRLAEFVHRRNLIDGDIAKLIGRPALTGHLGEFIAAEIFDIDLHPSATHKGSDGRFRTGALEGRTVNVKFYGRQEGLLDVIERDPPETYLVLTGDIRVGATSRGDHRPLQIRRVYLFQHERLVAAGVRLRTAASVRKALWADAEVWPSPSESLGITLTDEQRAALALFS